MIEGFYGDGEGGTDGVGRAWNGRQGRCAWILASLSVLLLDSFVLWK